mmetsp:Transcript_20859/g.33715  ORF Transcript_20859/g.33715 Transcript_20859/m.33715 type:complete len:201 (-) Transcript_20859:1092-1694(-)
MPPMKPVLFGGSGSFAGAPPSGRGLNIFPKSPFPALVAIFFISSPALLTILLTSCIAASCSFLPPPKSPPQTDGPRLRVGCSSMFLKPTLLPLFCFLNGFRDNADFTDLFDLTEVRLFLNFASSESKEPSSIADRCFFSEACDTDRLSIPIKPPFPFFDLGETSSSSDSESSRAGGGSKPISLNQSCTQPASWSAVSHGL